MTDILVYTEEQDTVIAGSVEPREIVVAVVGGVGGGSGGGGAVDSVNGRIGHVVLDATDVGADPAGTGAAAAASAVAAHVAAADPHTQYTTAAEAAAAAPVQSVNGEVGAVLLSATDVGADVAGTAVAAVGAHETDPTPHTTITQVRKLGFDADSGETAGTGEMVWNEADGTVDLGMPGGVTLQVGQEQLIRVLNKTGSTIQNMHVVYITGAQGNRVTAAQAQANNSSADKTLAVATQAIANNAEGFATLSGLVRGVDTSMWAEGVELWLSADTAGAITNVRPAAPNHQVRIGYVVRSHATVGSIYVTINIGSDLNHLHDVVITAPADNDVLIYDSATQTWQNGPQTGGSGEVNTASNIGTGVGVFASKVGVDLQFKSLIAGAGVTLTPTATGITIVASGAGGAVDSVNGQTGVVVLDTDDISEGATNLYFTTGRAAAAAPVQSVDGQTGAVSLSGSYAPLSHVGSGGTAHSAATAGTAGFMSAADKTKLDGVAAGATANANTDSLAEGGTNKYFTEGRVRGTVLTGLSLLTGGVISAADSVLSSLGKLQKQISDAVTAISGKQDTLVSGTNLKTLNGNSLLGGGDLTISGGGGGGLVNLSEAKTADAPNATVPVVSLSVTITEANGDYAIVPKGTGAIVAAIPNNLASGGNKRGSRAVDFQTERSTAARVASGNNAFIGSGSENTASGVRSFVGAGTSNIASGGNDVVAGGNGNSSSGGQNFIGAGTSNVAAGQHNTIAGGQNGNTGTGSFCFIGGGSANTHSGAGDYRSHLGGSANSATAAYASTTGGCENVADGRYSVTLGGYQASAKGVIGAVVHASGRFSSTGDAQAGRYTLRIATSSATPAVLTADASATQTAANSLTLGGQNAYVIRARIVARNTANGECTAWEVSAIARRTNTAATTALVGTPTVTSLGGDAALSAASIAVSANTTLGSVAFTVTGIAATNLRWMALVETVEVG